MEKETLEERERRREESGALAGKHAFEEFSSAGSSRRWKRVTSEEKGVKAWTMIFEKGQMLWRKWFAIGKIVLCSIKVLRGREKVFLHFSESDRFSLARLDAPPR